MSYETTLRDLPLVLRRLRLRAGFRSQRATVREIRRKTGVAIVATRIGVWERGRAVPSLRSIMAFLTTYGYTFEDLQQEIERVAAETPGPPPAAAAGESLDERRERLRRELAEYRQDLRRASET